jgi:hypothetical protein
MRITESRLRSVISNVINEMSHDALGHYSGPESYVGMGGVNVYARNPELMSRARACMSMDSRAIIAMCEEICKENPGMVEHCWNLCTAVLCDGNMNGCCECLESICACKRCCEICIRCCKC